MSLTVATKRCPLKIEHGSRVILTGASSGIGAEIAKQLAARGAKIALLARRKDQLESLAKDVRQEGGEAWAISCDVAQRESVREAFKEAIEKLGGVDIVILNAGIGKPTPAIAKLDVESFEDIIQINVMGVVYGIEQVLPHMLAAGKGAIVGVSSLAAYRGLPASTAYGASKAAVTNMLEGMRVELAPRGIEVITVSPGFVETPMTAKNKHPMPFMWPVERAARTIIMGIEFGKREIVFPLPLKLFLSTALIFPNALWDFLATVFGPRERSH